MAIEDRGAALCAVVSLYGQVDLAAMYEHIGQDKVCHPDDPQPDWTAPPPRWTQRLFGATAGRLRLQFFTSGGRCDRLLGGTPTEVPERYAQVSAIRHVHPGCPPTLLLHGQHEMAPVAAARQLRPRLDEAGVPMAAVYLPHTDRMFDVIGTAFAARAGGRHRIDERQVPR